MFKDKTVIVTGGSSGIGREIALMFAKNGANVVISFKNNMAGAKEVVDEIKKYDKKVSSIQANLINDSEAKNLIDKTIDKFGKIDILINNAGRYIDGDEWDGDAEIWMKSIQQNLISMMSTSKYASQHFLKQKNGVIVNIASVHGVKGKPDAISYSAAKAGVINLTQSYSLLLSPFGRANSVSPAQTNAGYWLTAPKEEVAEVLAKKPNHKLIEPATIAEKVIFLASDQAKDINGQNFIITE